MSEVWKQIPGYEGAYDVSDDGRVRSWKNGRWGNKRDEPKVLRPLVNSDGYHRVGLWLGGVGKYHKAHRLVMLAFVGASDLDVNHINGIKDDNRLPNLEYCTGSENCIHARDVLGDNGNQVLTRNEAEEVIALLAEGKLMHREIAGMFGVVGKTISHIWLGESWTDLPRPWTIGMGYPTWKRQRRSEANQPIQQGA